MDFTAIFCIVDISLGIILKNFGFDLGYSISSIGLFILAVIFIPIIIIVIAKYKENRLKRIVILALSLSYIILHVYISSLFNLKPNVLNAFEIIDKSMEIQNLTQIQQNHVNYDELLKNHPKKDIILKLRQKSDSICDYIQSLKVEIVKTCSKNDSMLYNLLFKEKKASILKKSIEDYKTFIKINFSDNIDSIVINKSLSTKIGNPNFSKTWEDENFNHLPKIGVITILFGIQANIRNVENSITEDLKNNITPANKVYKP